MAKKKKPSKELEAEKVEESLDQENVELEAKAEVSQENKSNKCDELKSHPKFAKFKVGVN